MGERFCRMKNNSLYFRPALFAGLILSIVNFVPGLDLVNCFCCAGLLAGGVLAVIFFKMDLPPEQQIMNIDGFYLGLWTGIFGAGFETVLDITIGPFIADVKFRMIQNLIKTLFGSIQIPSDLMDQLSQAISAAKRPHLIDTLLSFFMIVIIYSIFTIFGALMTTAFIQKRKAKQQ
jgi:hypothetical protein